MPTLLGNGPLFLNTYQTIRPLGSGGMGQAFLGLNVHTQTPVVIKRMLPHLARDPASRRRFAGEVDLLGRLRHPHIVALLDADPEDPEQPFLIQEFVDGQALDEVIKKEGRLSPLRVGRLLGQLCQALHALHGKGILHRDLTPANITLAAPGTPGETVKLMDFGLASLGASAGVYLSLDKLTGPEGTIGGGTPDFLCPEQVRKETVDRRGDLYSVGVLLFQMLTGWLPFADAGSVAEILLAHLHRPPPRFASLGTTNLPPALEKVVRRLLAKQPAERPADAREVAEVFGRALGVEIASPEAFQDQPGMHDTVEAPFPDDLDILDRLEAWMPEQIAVMKLRGFLDQVDGEVVSSLPGKIRVRILDPRNRPQPESRGLFSFLGFKRAALPEPHYLHLELLMEKGSHNGGGLVEMTVVLEPGSPSSGDPAMRRGFAERICRELRAYLMV